MRHRGLMLMLAVACGGRPVEPSTPWGPSTDATVAESVGIAPEAEVERGTWFSHGAPDHVPLEEGSPLVIEYGPMGREFTVQGKLQGVGNLVTLEVWVEEENGDVFIAPTGAPVLLSGYNGEADQGEFSDTLPAHLYLCIDDETVCAVQGTAGRLCLTARSVEHPVAGITECVAVTLQVDAWQQPLCDAVADGSWYPGWPGCELNAECTQQVDPTCQ